MSGKSGRAAAGKVKKNARVKSRIPKVPPEIDLKHVELFGWHGMSVPTMAAKLGIDRRVLGEMFRTMPELQEAFSAGEQRYKDELRTVLRQNATGRAGKTNESAPALQGSQLTVAIFMGKCELGLQETQSVTHKVEFDDPTRKRIEEIAAKAGKTPEEVAALLHEKLSPAVPGPEGAKRG